MTKVSVVISVTVIISDLFLSSHSRAVKGKFLDNGWVYAYFNKLRFFIRCQKFFPCFKFLPMYSRRTLVLCQAKKT